MKAAHAVAGAALGIVLVAGLIPAVAQSSMSMVPNARTGMAGHRHGMLGIMSGGCGGMMQSMNGGGRPNSQWRNRPPGTGSMVN